MLLGIISWVLIHIAVFCKSHYTNEWAVHIEGGEDVARSVAKEHGFIYLHEIIPNYYKFEHHQIKKRSLEPNDHHHASLLNNNQVKWAEQQVVLKRVKRDLSNLRAFNDPMWPNMWYLNREDDNNMNVLDAYRKYNITGVGVRVTILDDGIEKDHPDLFLNYDPGSSYDINDQDNDPQPRYEDTNDNKHGTRCAGEVAAMANNNFCAVGVAYNSRIGGVRMLDGDVTDAVESQALGLNPNHIDIYSASWGPEDNGMTVDGPGSLARKAIFDGVVKGRNGLGNIFVWASGNGGSKGDSCSCDGYTNSIYTLSVSSVSERGLTPWYSEPCASTMAATYSSGANGIERTIVTTDIHKKCTAEHTGTSASAPLAAGLCALALEANKQLTWRDMQYVVFLTARPANLDADDWVTNGVGKRVSHHYGFGLMDAEAMVKVAKGWLPLPEHHRCPTPTSYLLNNKMIENHQSESTTISTSGCEGTADAISFLEHVECVVTLEGNRRGEMQLFLISPVGTKSQLLPKRESDYSHTGFKSWTFMTTHNWGENPKGDWKLLVSNENTNSKLKEWSLVFYGVSNEPEVYKQYLRLTPNTTDRPAIEMADRLKAIDAKYSAVNQSNSKSVETTLAIPATLKTEKICLQDQYLHRNECLPKCPDGYYARKNDKLCLPCNSECAICLNADSCIIKLKFIDERSWKSAIFVIGVLMAVVVFAGAFLLIVLLRRRKRKNLKFLDLQPFLFSDVKEANPNGRLIFHGSSGKNSEVQIPTLESSDRTSVKAPLLLNGEESSDDENYDPDKNNQSINSSVP